jgi:hypothetical protein
MSRRLREKYKHIRIFPVYDRYAKLSRRSREEYSISMPRCLQDEYKKYNVSPFTKQVEVGHS